MVISHDVALRTQQPAGAKGIAALKDLANRFAFLEHGRALITSDFLSVVTAANRLVNIILKITLGITIPHFVDFKAVIMICSC